MPAPRARSRFPLLAEKPRQTPEVEERMENARVTNIRRVPQFYSPADEPYLASSSFEQFKALSRVEPADDPFRDSDDDFRHIPHVKRPAAIFLLSADAYVVAARAVSDRSGYTPPRRVDCCVRLACERGTNEFRVMAGIIARRVITAECGGFDIKSVARMPFPFARSVYACIAPP